MNYIFKKSYLLLLLIGISISLMLGFHTYNTHLEKEQIQFESITKNTIQQIKNKMDNYREILYSGGGLFEASTNVRRKEWNIFVNKLQIDKYLPGMQGFGYSVVIRENELNKHIQSIKDEGFPSYRIHPSGKRDLYTSIIYIEPFNQRNQRAFGYDMFSEKKRRNAMKKSIETGFATLSKKVTLVQENGNDVQSGFLLYTPLYKKLMPIETKEQRYKAIKGFVYAVFRTKDFINSAVADSLKIIDMKMYDGTIKNKNTLLFDSNINRNIDNTFIKNIELKIYGHSWTFEIIAKNTFLDSQKNIYAFIFTILGFLITFIITLLVKRQSEVEAEKKTQDLLEEQNTFLSLFDKGDIVLFKWKNNETTNTKKSINWNVVYVSNSVEKLLGYKTTNFISNNITYNSCIHKDDLQVVKQEVQEAIKENKDFFIHKPYRIITKDKKIKWVLDYTVTQKNKNGKILYFIGYIIDITEQKNLEYNLIKAKEEAENASKAKTEFLANISHEMRTPLNGIIGLTSLILETKLTDMQKSYLTKSITSSKALLHVINDILDHSKIEANKIELEHIHFELDKMLHQVSNLFIYEAQKKDIDLDYTIAPSIYNNLIGDPFRINQILINLVGNAIKFTHNGFIKINVDLEKKENKIKLNFSVRDTGIGISKIKQKKLFKNFSQVDTSNTRKYGGSGLGLVISQKLAHIMGGEISLESTEEIGSVFNFSVEVEYTEKDYKFLSQDLKNKKVLIISNKKEMRENINKTLKMFTLNTIVCDDGKAALKIIEKEEVNYIIVEWEIPNIDGIEFAKIVDTIHHDKNIKIIIVSSFNKKEQLINAAKTAGINKHNLLIKPFSSSTLLDILINNIKLKKHENIKKLFAKGKVLLVEDNEINQLVAKQNLENFGLEVRTAVNGEIAVQKAQGEHYDIIFMDLQMPVMDGFEASKKIREFNLDTPIIALSAAVMEEDLVMSKEALMNEHLSKPIDIEKLEKVLIKYLETSFKELTNENKTIVEESISGINLEEFYIRLNNNKQLAYKMLIKFSEDKKNIVQELSSLDIESNEFNSLIHNLKGLSGNLSLTEVFKYSSEIYTSNILEKKIELLPKLKESLCIAIKSIHKKIIPRIVKTDNTNNFSRNEIIENIKNLINDISKGTFINHDRKNLIISQIIHISNNNIANKLEKQLSSFDYKSAQITLENIIGDLS